MGFYDAYHFQKDQIILSDWNLRTAAAVAPRHFIVRGIGFNKNLTWKTVDSVDIRIPLLFLFRSLYSGLSHAKLLGILQILQSSARAGGQSLEKKRCVPCLVLFNICYPLVNTQEKTIGTRAISPGLFYKW